MLPRSHPLILAGCYQCIVEDGAEQMVTTAQLKLGDSPPVLLETFPDGQVYEEGVPVSLKCIAQATPLPQIRWFLDDLPLDGYAPRRLSQADYVTPSGQVVSYVNISNAKVVDGGEVRRRRGRAGSSEKFRRTQYNFQSDR